MLRKPAKERNPIRGATLARDYSVGDEVLFTYGGTAGAALVVGQLRDDPTCLVLAFSDESTIEMPAAYCSPTGVVHRQLGYRYRSAYERLFSRKLR